MADLTHITTNELRAELTRRRHRTPPGVTIIDITPDVIEQIRHLFDLRRGDLPLTIPCPLCHVAPGERCRRPSGKLWWGVHTERSNAVDLKPPVDRWYRCVKCKHVFKLASTAVHHASHPPRYCRAPWD